jgi:hypothetical protein
MTVFVERDFARAVKEFTKAELGLSDEGEAAAVKPARTILDTVETSEV